MAIYWPSRGVSTVSEFGADWAPFLSRLPAPQPTITVSSWQQIKGANVTRTNARIEGSMTKVRVGGGTANDEIILRNFITLSNGEQYYEDCFQKIRS